MIKNNIHKNNIIKIIVMLLLLILFGMIFIFSGQNGQKSTRLSRTVTNQWTKNISYVQNLEANEKEVVLLKIEAFIRKLAHFLLYTLMGILLITTMILFKVKLKKGVILSFSIGAIYAILDELHQLFIPERTARIIDVVIDSMRNTIWNYGGMDDLERHKKDKNVINRYMLKLICFYSQLLAYIYFYFVHKKLI